MKNAISPIKTPMIGEDMSDIQVVSVSKQSVDPAIGGAIREGIDNPAIQARECYITAYRIMCSMFSFFEIAYSLAARLKPASHL